MKKFLFFFLSFVLLVLLVSCGNENSSNSTNDTNTTSTSEESHDSNKVETQSIKFHDAAEFEEIVSKDVEETIAELTAKYDSLISEINTYDKYIQSSDKVKAYYDLVVLETKNLCIRLREYSASYAEYVLSSNLSNEEKRDALDSIFDCVYEDASDDIFDEIYDGILDDMYHSFYDGIINDAYESASYSEWSDALSDEYRWWSDALSDVYDEWSDLLSDIYDLWSDLNRELWDNDIERANSKLSDFREEIEELKEDT